MTRKQKIKAILEEYEAFLYDSPEDAVIAFLGEDDGTKEYQEAYDAQIDDLKHTIQYVVDDFKKFLNKTSMGFVDEEYTSWVTGD